MRDRLGVVMGHLVCGPLQFGCGVEAERDIRDEPGKRHAEEPEAALKDGRQHQQGRHHGSGEGDEGHRALVRPQHGEGYYAAFIRDPDGNRVEAVTFTAAE